VSLLEVSDVHKRFGRLQALGGVSFAVEQGEVFGIAGPNGAGKSVLMQTLSGRYRPDKGDIRFEGTSLVGMSSTKICHLGLTRTFQTPTTFPSLSVRDNVRVGATFGGRGGRSVDDMLQKLDLHHVADHAARNLDLFTLKRVVLGAALATGCRVLLLDEPMAGFSMLEVEQYLKLIHDIKESMGVTIIIIEHLLDVLIGVSDQLMILHYGEVLFNGPPEDVRSHAEVAEVYLGDKHRGLHA
jgi:branched-chain amino acid transport system ATP-binding protein